MLSGSFCFLVRVYVAVIKHHDPHELGEEMVSFIS